MTTASDYGCPTTRVHPRTMSDAFKGVDYACAVERPMRRFEDALDWLDSHWPALFALAGAIGGALAWVRWGVA